MVKLVNQWCQVLANVAVTQMFPDDRSVFGFDQGVVIAVPGARFGQFDQEFLEELDHMLIDVFRAVISMKFKDAQGELIQ